MVDRHPYPVGRGSDRLYFRNSLSRAPGAHPMTHENARAVSPVGIGIGVSVAIAIGRHFDIDSDSEPDTDSDPGIP